MRYFLLSCLLGCCLTACAGFHLRTTPMLSPPLNHLALKTNQPFEALTQQLTETLQQNRVTLSPPGKAPFTLVILNHSLTTQQTSLGSSQQAREYIATYTISYALEAHNGPTVWGPRTVRVSHPFMVLADTMLENTDILPDIQTYLTLSAVHHLIMQLNAEAIHLRASTSPAVKSVV